MDATRTTRPTMYWWLLVVAALAIGGFGAEVAAKPTKELYGRSISERVRGFEHICEDFGGTTNVSYGYEENEDGDQVLVSASAECKGGGDDGSVCNYTAETNDCYRTIRPDGHPTTRPERAQGGETTLARDPGLAGPTTPAGQVLVNRAQPASDAIPEDDEG